MYADDAVNITTINISRYDDVNACVSTATTSQAFTPLSSWRAPPLLTAVFCIIALAGLLSNIFVLVVFGRAENLRRASSLCIINLAIGDMIVCLLVPLRIMSYEGLITWSDGLCRAYTVLRFLPIFVSINTMIVMALDRRMAILDPAQFRNPYRSRSMTSRLLGTWMLAIIELGVPVYRTQLVRCADDYCCQVYELPSLIYIFTLIIALPCSVLAFIYGHIFIALQLKYAARRATVSAGTRVQVPADSTEAAPAPLQPPENYQQLRQPHPDLVPQQQQQQGDEVRSAKKQHRQQQNVGRRSSSPQRRQQQQQEIIIVVNGAAMPIARTRRSGHAIKAAKVLLLTTVLFVVCYLPTYVLWFVYIVHPVGFVGSLTSVYLFQSCSMLIFVHSSLNPIVYFASSASYRRQLRRALTCFYCCQGQGHGQGGGQGRKGSSVAERTSRWRDGDSFESAAIDDRSVSLSHVQTALSTVNGDSQATKRFLDTKL